MLVWGALVTPLLTQRGVLNGDSESLGAFLWGPLVTPGVTTGPQSLSLETENFGPAPENPQNPMALADYGETPSALALGVLR